MRLLRGDILENLKMALSTLRANKLRSFLTVIGVVIGVWTVMAIASIISGIDVAVEKEIESLGTRSIFVSKFDIGIRTGALTREERMRKDLTLEDALAIKGLPAVEVADFFLDISNDPFGKKILVTNGGKTSAAINLEGTLPGYEVAGIRKMNRGRFFTSFENETNQEVCIVGSSVAENFFPYGSPVGHTIQIGGREFRVIGDLLPREQLFGGGNDNDIIFMPLGVARKFRPNAKDVTITAVARAGQINEAKDQIADLMRVRRRVPFDQPNNFSLTTADSIISNFRDITFGVAIAMIAISSVGLMVGGIGVMNIMLVSVTERTREIGIRKAIGAKRADILWQFLIEAMTLTGVGGLIGLLFGWATTMLIRMFIPSYVPIWAPIAGFVASVGIGLVFGLWPAWKAARLDPIEALRYE
ncbi:MAG: ABC transporter permease [Pyrinomonadaceae bacterium]